MDGMNESKELTGVATMDSEHAGQLSLLNDLKAAVRNGADDSLISRVTQRVGGTH